MNAYCCERGHWWSGGGWIGRWLWDTVGKASDQEPQTCICLCLLQAQCFWCPKHAEPGTVPTPGSTPGNAELLIAGDLTCHTGTAPAWHWNQMPPTLHSTRTLRPHIWQWTCAGSVGAKLTNSHYTDRSPSLTLRPQNPLLWVQSQIWLLIECIPTHTPLWVSQLGEDEGDDSKMTSETWRQKTVQP